MFTVHMTYTCIYNWEKSWSSKNNVTVKKMLKVLKNTFVCKNLIWGTVLIFIATNDFMNHSNIPTIHCVFVSNSCYCYSLMVLSWFSRFWLRCLCLIFYMLFHITFTFTAATMALRPLTAKIYKSAPHIQPQFSSQHTCVDYIGKNKCFVSCVQSKYMFHLFVIPRGYCG